MQSLAALDIEVSPPAVLAPLAFPLLTPAEEYTLIYEQHYHRMHALARSRVYNADTAADIVADVFLKFWEKWDEWEDRGVPRSHWLYTALYRRVVDYYRTTTREREVKPKDMSLAETRGSVMFSGESEEHSSSSLSDLRLDMLRVLSSLKPSTRMMVLIIAQGYSNEECGVMTGSTADAVKVRVFRARQLMRERFGMSTAKEHTAAKRQQKEMAVEIS